MKYNDIQTIKKLQKRGIAVGNPCRVDETSRFFKDLIRILHAEQKYYKKLRQWK